MGSARRSPTAVPERPADEVHLGPAGVSSGQEPRARGWRRELLWAVAAGLVATVAGAIDLRLWDASLHVPLISAGGDSNLTLAVIKGLLEHGWVFTNPDIGAPGGTQFYDFPVGFGDVVHLLILRGLGIVFDDPVAVVNVFFVLSYGLIAASAHGVLRALGIPRAVALLCGVLYALLPFHTFRFEAGHLTLATYYVVPLGAWLALGATGMFALFERQPEARVGGWATRRTAITLIVAVVTALGTLYYALFTLVLIGLMAPIAYLAHRRRGALVQAGLVLAVVLGTTALAQAPAVLYQRANGVNQAVGVRTAGESEIFGLKLGHLVMPRPGHRVAALSRVGQRYVGTPTEAEGFNPSLGLAMTIGFAAVVLALLLGGLRQAIDPGRRLMVTAGLGAVVCFGMGTVGGGSALFAYLVSPQVRAWNRISIFLAFFALIGFALLATRLRLRLSGRAPGWAIGAMLAVVGVLGYLDETSPTAPDYARTRAEWTNDARFVRAIEERVPAGSSILQLPYVAFPENPGVVRMADYDHFQGYVHSKDLRWSYGEMKGRSDDWADDAAALPLETQLRAAVAAGFAGIYVDQAGYADGGTDVIARIGRLLGSEATVTSGDGRQVFFALDSLARDVRASVPPEQIRATGRALTAPVTPVYGKGFGDPEADATTQWRWAAGDATLRLENPLDRPRRVRLTGAIAGPVGGIRSEMTLIGPSGFKRAFAADANAPLPLDQELVVPPGGATLRVVTSGPAGADAPAGQPERRARLVNLQVVDPVISAFAARFRRSGTSRG